MKTTYKVVEILIGHLVAIGIESEIDGDIYRVRPMNSKQSDIVVNALPIDNEQLQSGILNVNIHVPNLVVNVNSVQDNSQPDTEKMEAITEKVIAAIDEVWDADYSFHVQQQMVFEEPAFNEHYSNIRVEFNSENL